MNGIFKEISSNPQFTPNRSMDWFRKKIKEAGGLNLKPADKRLFTQNQEYVRNRIYPGSLYFYGYNPKYKNVLPYYDMFPLTFIIGATSTHFTGINFHYLPMHIRITLFDKLMKHQTTWHLDDKKRIKADWTLLSNAARYPEVGPAVKQYLISHVMTKFIRVPLDDMKIAMLLPVEKFIGATSLGVQRMSMKQVRRVR